MKLKTFGTMKSYFSRHHNISKKIKHWVKLPNKETNNFQCKYFHVHTARRFLSLQTRRILIITRRI